MTQKYIKGFLAPGAIGQILGMVARRAKIVDEGSGYRFCRLTDSPCCRVASKGSFTKSRDYEILR
jgi:hypothetical protein